VRYDLGFPDGRTFANDNPSGNREWEQFKISTGPFDRSTMDYSTSTIPPGIYSLTIQGVDMLNLNALLLPFRVLCVDEAGAPCSDLPRPFRIGDTVFEDRNGNGIQDNDEPGIPVSSSSCATSPACSSARRPTPPASTSSRSSPATTRWSWRRRTPRPAARWPATRRPRRSSTPTPCCTTMS
jgi:hypothetical protein